MGFGFGRLERWLMRLLVVSGFCAVFPRVLEVTAEIPKEKMGDYATWFSAVGTILAFAATLGVAYWSWRNAQADRVTDKEVVAQAVLALAYDYRFQVNRQLRTMQRPVRTYNLPKLLTPPDLFGDILRALNKIELHELPTTASVYYTMTARRQIERAIAIIEEANNVFSEVHDAVRYEVQEARLDEIRTFSDQFVADWQDVIRSLGRVPHEEPSYIALLRKGPIFGQNPVGMITIRRPSRRRRESKISEF